MSQHPSRSSTPNRIYSSSRLSSSRTSLHLPKAFQSSPQPKVLPFPDLPVRPIMSRDPSRGPSPVASPGLSSPGSGTDSFPFGSSSSADAATAAAAAANSTPSSGSSIRFGHTLTPTVSASRLNAVGNSTPRPLRPRAQTASAVSPARPEGFQVISASSSRADTPSSPPPQLSLASSPPSSASAPIPIPAGAAPPTAPIPILTNSQPMPPRPFAAHPAVASPPTRAASIPHDPTPPLAPRESVRVTPSKKASLPPDPLPASIPVTPPAPSGALIDHLYRSLKTGACADVRLWVRKWGVGWLVHKMVLVQAGFFHSLFMGGFSETRQRNKSQIPGDEWTGEDIELTFDDPNITRAAFEICLQRLYSSYPQLHFPVSLLPTAAQPLTPSFPPPAEDKFPSLQAAAQNLPEHTQLVTPRLLLSLLATATYLGQQYLLREVLAIVLRTVCPQTVNRYLYFAIGHGIGEEEWDNQDDEGARGMETVAKTVASGFVHTSAEDWSSVSGSDESSPTRGARLSTDSNSSTYSDEGPSVAKVEGEISHRSVTRSDSIRSTSTVRPGQNGLASLSTFTVHEETPEDFIMPHFYGFVSDRIGEACVCWLARWGLDVLKIEEQMAEVDPQHDGPLVWAQGGVPANFVAAVLSSDALFVPNEIERYRMTRRVLELRRASWHAMLESEQSGTPSVNSEPESIEGWDEDERELAKVFVEGIYYSHMKFDDLSSIASDIDPSTTLPYAPLNVLQAAHWAAADLKTRITSEKDEDHDTGELGLTLMSGNILQQRRRLGPRVRAGSSPYTLHNTLSFSSLSSSLSSFTPAATDPLYHPVPVDDTTRIGAGRLVFLNPSTTNPITGLTNMPNLGPDWNGQTGSGSGKDTETPPQNEKTFFGILRGARRASEIEAKMKQQHQPLLAISEGKAKEEKWSKLEPFRFSVEFWGVDKLSEKERLYSATHFYAGSYFNVYVTTTRKKDKGVQLGIYLHRQSTAEPFPPVCTPACITDSPTTSDPAQTNPTLDGRAASPVTLHHMASSVTLNQTQTRLGLYRTMSTSPPTTGSPPMGTTALPETGGERDHSNYLDPRRVTKAYFSISCASALGTALVRFSSAPDKFALSQSWGWKSSALRSEEYLSVPSPIEKEGESSLGWVGDCPEGGSLRATVVVGII